MLREHVGALVILAGSISYVGAAVTIDVSTTSANTWLATGAGATAVPAWQVNPAEISITSNALNSGTFVSGGSLANFNGFWYSDLSFALPANATNISFSFSGLNADDRVVLQLNGANIGNYFLNASPGNGVMSFPPGPPDVPFTFTNQTSGTVSSGFLLGQNNDLRLIVNNTGSPALNSSTKTFQSSGDGCDASFTGTVTYFVPEPTIIGLLVPPLLAGLSARRRL